MTLLRKTREELLVLAEAHLEDQLDDDQQARLEELVCGSPEAAELFVRYTSVASLLERRDRLAEATIEDESPEEETVSLARRTYLYLSQPFQISVIIASLAVTIGLLSLALVRVTFGPADRARPAVAKVEFVGRLTRVDDCQWSGDTLTMFGEQPKTNTGLEANRMIDLLSGNCDVQLDSGVRLRIVGPAAWRIRNDNEIEFLQGEMTAYVPERGIGFIAHAAGAKLIDLGTEFGLAVAGNEAAEAHVYRGEVSVELEAGAAADQPIRLSNNEALRWRRGEAAATERMASNGARFRRWLPGSEVPSLFIADRANREPAEKLPFVPAGDDLLEGLLPMVEPSLTPTDGQLAQLTDGRNSGVLGSGDDGRVILDAVNSTRFTLTYDLELPEGEAVRIDQLRVFTYNTDSRVFLDCDLEGSLDGERWFPLHQRLTIGRRGVDFNLPSGTSQDYFYDYALARLQRRDALPPVRQIRLTFRGVFDGKDFARFPTNRHSAITEIDLIGEVDSLQAGDSGARIDDS